MNVYLLHSLRDLLTLFIFFIFPYEFMEIQIGDFLRTPCIKFIAQTCSFVAFLTMIIGHSLLERSRGCIHFQFEASFSKFLEGLSKNRSFDVLILANLNGNRVCTREYHLSAIQLGICVWILGRNNQRTGRTNAIFSYN